MTWPAVSALLPDGGGDLSSGRSCGELSQKRYDSSVF